jgi:hypothetical protein
MKLERMWKEAIVVYLKAHFSVLLAELTDTMKPLRITRLLAGSELGMRTGDHSNTNYQFPLPHSVSVIHSKPIKVCQNTSVIQRTNFITVQSPS